MDKHDVDGAAELAQRTAHSLGKYEAVDLAVVVLVHVCEDGERLYRVGAHVPNLDALKEALRGVLDGMEHPDAVKIDRRAYKPERDGH